MTVKGGIVKGLAILLCTITVSALALFAMGRISAMMFWTLAALAALAAFVVLPWLKKR